MYWYIPTDINLFIAVFKINLITRLEMYMYLGILYTYTCCNDSTV